MENEGSGTQTNCNAQDQLGEAQSMNNVGDFTQQNAVMAELPRYLCHKKVWALKIKAIIVDGQGEDRETDGSAMIYPEESAYAPFRVDHAYMHKHKPQVGGYYVVYDDGYKLFSPAKAFEDGYTKI